MPLPPDELARFEAAADEALQALKKLEASLTPEQKEGFNKLRQWWQSYSMKCGHKRAHNIMMGRRG
jgi:hypothetical protein